MTNANPTATPAPGAQDHRPPPVDTPSGPSIHPAAYPHIWDLILAHVDDDDIKVSVALRDTCTTLRSIICSRLYADVLVSDEGYVVLYTAGTKGTGGFEWKDASSSGLHWHGGDILRQLCVERLKYCRRLQNELPGTGARMDADEIALLGQGLVNVETLRIDSDKIHWFNHPNLATVAGTTDLQRPSMDYQCDADRWGVDTDEPPEDRTEVTPTILCPQFVPPSAKVILYQCTLSDTDGDHGNRNVIVKTDLSASALPHLTDVAFLFYFWEGMEYHRPNNHKPLGVLHTLVRSIADAIPRVRVTFKGLEGYEQAWFCPARISVVGDDKDDDQEEDGNANDQDAIWRQYMRHYIAQYILWVKTNPGKPGESFFKWATRVHDDDDERDRLRVALEPILAAISVEHSDAEGFIGSEAYHMIWERAPRDPQEPEDYDGDLADCFESIVNHGDDDYDSDGKEEEE